jgi:RimJ/RimL family protein N-acetyltransferase
MEDCEQVRLWRNEALYALRTPYQLTQEQQADFYRNVVCDRNARARYWAVRNGAGERHAMGEAAHPLIGMVGLENIEWENRRAEISIMLDPAYRGKGYGETALELLLEQGFKHLNLDHIWGECYGSNPAMRFWTRMADKHNGKTAIITDTKYWDGTYYPSYHFTFARRGWK